MREVKEVVTKSGERRYRVRYRLSKRQSSQTFYKKADAQTFAALLDVSAGDALAWLDARDQRATDVTFAQWHETWCDQLTGIQPRTREDYRALRRRYLAHLEELPLNLVTRTHVTALVNDLDRAGRSPKTIKNVLHMLSSCLALAVDEGHMPINPCRRVRLPSQSFTEHDTRFLTHEEFGRLYEALDPHYRDFVAFLVGTGLRWSEATAIQTKHVDLAAGTVRVRQAWKKGPGGTVLGVPKSRKSNRTVNAATLALAAASRHMGKPDDFVFTTPSGRVIHYSNFRERVWVPACERAGLHPRPSPHSLRHTHASWLISDGQTIEAVQDQLGHESSETTRKVYAQLLPAVGVAVGRSASAALERALAQRVEAPDLPLALQARGHADQ